MYPCLISDRIVSDLRLEKCLGREEVRLQEVEFAGGVQAVNEVNGQFGRKSFVVHVHEKIQFFQAMIDPVCDAGDPFIYAGIIGWVQTVANIPYECFGNGQSHVCTIPSSARSCNYGAYSGFMQEAEQFMADRCIAEPGGVTQFHEKLQIGGK